MGAGLEEPCLKEEMDVREEGTPEVVEDNSDYDEAYERFSKDPDLASYVEDMDGPIDGVLHDFENFYPYDPNDWVNVAPEDLYRTLREVGGGGWDGAAEIIRAIHDVYNEKLGLEPVDWSKGKIVKATQDNEELEAARERVAARLRIKDTEKLLEDTKRYVELGWERKSRLKEIEEYLEGLRNMLREAQVAGEEVG